ncbi:MAG: hypothetical protein JO369_04605 [Paucibacter sp.]|nr:hypothetical protein [Roseateles sp.]
MNDKATPMQPGVSAETQQLRQQSLSTRLKLLLLAETKDKGRYSWLEGQTGIPAATWRTWWTRGGVPGGQLVEAAALKWPQFAFWLVTGHTDVRCGHDMPSLAPEAQGYIDNGPEEGSLRIRRIKNGYSQQYLKLSTQTVEMEAPQLRKTRNDVDVQMWRETLRIVSSRRLAEITENFKTPLLFEDAYLAELLGGQ